MHTAAVVGVERFRHEGDGFTMPFRDVAHDVLVVLHPVAHLLHRCEPNVDLGLAGGSDFVMLSLDGDARFFQFQTHFVTDVLQCVRRRNREITFLRANFVAEVWELLARAIPMSFRTFDAMK